MLFSYLNRTLTIEHKQFELIESSQLLFFCKTSVRQGSIPGPLLIIIYTSRFSKSLDYYKIHMYAGDIHLYYSFAYSDYFTVETLINNDLSEIAKVSK